MWTVVKNGLLRYGDESPCKLEQIYKEKRKYDAISLYKKKKLVGLGK